MFSDVYESCSIATRCCTRCAPLCDGMPLPISHLYQTLCQTYTSLLRNATRCFNSIEGKNILVSSKYSRLVAFRSRGVYIWYNVWYKCQILPEHLWPGGQPCGCILCCRACAYWKNCFPMQNHFLQIAMLPQRRN